MKISKIYPEFEDLLFKAKKIKILKTKPIMIIFKTQHGFTSKTFYGKIPKIILKRKRELDGKTNYANKKV